MAQNEKQLANLKKGNPETQFKPGRDQVEISKKANEAKKKKRKRRQSLGEAAQIAAKMNLNDIGLNALKRRGLDIDSVDPDDLIGVMALAMGQMIAGINGNSQAAQNFADWLDISTKHKQEQLELEKTREQIEKLRIEQEKLKAEIERLRSGQDAGDDDQVLQFIEGMKHNDQLNTEAD